MNAPVQKHIIVTGPESSGGSLVAQTIAHALGITHYNDWNGMVPHIVANQQIKVQHTSLPFGSPSKFPDVRKWIRKNNPPLHFVLTARDNGISIRSKMRRAEKTFDEAQADNAEAAHLMAEIASSPHPHLFFAYEALIFLGLPYLQTLYHFLDIESDFMPPIADANARYLKLPRQEDGPRETIRPSL